MAHYYRIRKLNMCIDCKKQVQEINPRTGKRKCRCETCAEMKRKAYREAKACVI